MRTIKLHGITSVKYGGVELLNTTQHNRPLTPAVIAAVTTLPPVSRAMIGPRKIRFERSARTVAKKPTKTSPWLLALLLEVMASRLAQWEPQPHCPVITSTVADEQRLTAAARKRARKAARRLELAQ